MPTYNVHIYRVMKLRFDNIEAEAPEAAAAKAKLCTMEGADDCSECDGEDITALVDVAGDGDFGQSVTIDFEDERVRKAAPDLLAFAECSAAMDCSTHDRRFDPRPIFRSHGWNGQESMGLFLTRIRRDAVTKATGHYLGRADSVEAA